MLAVLAMLAAACGGTTTGTTASSDAAATAEAQSGGGDSEQESASTSEAPAGSGEIDLGEDGELHLDDFIPGAQAFDEDTNFRAQEMEIQQKIAECMAAEGFEYIPFVPSDVGGGFEFDESDQEEYVKTHGFGVSTWVLQEEAFGYDEESDPWADDPNREIQDAMDELEREEYYRVLYGGEPPIIEETPQEELDAMTPEELDQFYMEAYENWQPDGCEPRAYEEAFGGGESDMAFWEEFGEDLDEVFMRVESDPRIVEAQQGWSACMAAKGHDFADQEEMYAYFFGTDSAGEWVEGEFQQRVNELIVFPEPDPSYFENLEEGEEPDPSLWAPQYDIELLQPLIDEEIAVATADYECSQDMWELFETVHRELEQQFIEENLDRLMAFKEEHG
jgi:hypothetical protein